MTVAELIKLLEKCDPRAPITVWDAFADDYSFDVYVCKVFNGNVNIGSAVFGEVVK